MSSSRSAAIVGGGVIGAFCAYYLLEKGWSITLLDKGRFGAGASCGNCGLIVPNHILPLNDPGNLLKAIFWLFKKDAPLHVKPQFNIALIKWFANFAKRCSRKDVYVSAGGRHALLQSSFKCYPALIESEKIDCDWAVAGLLQVFGVEKKWLAYKGTDAMLRHYGIAGEQMDRRAIAAMEPSLGSDLAGGWYYRDSAHLRPDHLLHEMQRLLFKKGARIIENREATGFVTENNRAVAVRTRDGIFSADAFVVATGAWTPMFAKTLGCHLPIQPGKGFSITMKRSRNYLRLPLIFEEKSVVATPWPSGFRLGGTMEFTGFEPSLNRRRLDALTRAAAGYLRNFNTEGIKEEWCGFRPMTFDGLPIIDRSKRLVNVMIAAGHNMEGLSMGPGTGKLVAEMLNNDSPHIDPGPYGTARFDS
jgi:D-amino-acid dehydrogenase